MTYTAKISDDLMESSRVLADAATVLAHVIKEVVAAVITSYNNGGIVYFFGNGGSAADAQHLATELVCRFKKNRKALPALALTTDTSLLTAVANDFDFARIFERQVEAFVKKGDVVIGISTSGSSENVRRGLVKAKEQGATTVAFLGSAPGTIGTCVDIAVQVPSSNTPRVQECHIAIGHIICDIVEQSL